METRAIFIAIGWFVLVTALTIIFDRLASTKWALFACGASLGVLGWAYYGDIMKWAVQNKWAFIGSCALASACVGTLIGAVLVMDAPPVSSGKANQDVAAPPLQTQAPANAPPPPVTRIPAGMTISPPAVDIKLIFKSSRAFNQKTRNRITRDVTKFRDYLVGLRIPVPLEVPPISSSSDNAGRGLGSATPTGLPSYRGTLILGEKVVGDPAQATQIYCGHVLQVFNFSPGSPILPAFGIQPHNNIRNLTMSMMFSEWFCEYLNASFWNKPPDQLMRAFLPGALWEIRQKFGKEFADQMLGFSFQAMMDDPIASANQDIAGYFREKLRIGESVVDNDEGENWPVIDEILKKHEGTWTNPSKPQ